jgi:hypothetical protein
MPTNLSQPTPIPEPDVVRPPTPQETPQQDIPSELPQPGPDVVLPPEPEVTTPPRPSEVPPERPGLTRQLLASSLAGRMKPAGGERRERAGRVRHNMTGI